MINFDVISIFPEMFDILLKQGVIARAAQQNLFKINLHQLRDFSDHANRNIDDSSYGGGGQVMMISPLEKAVKHCSNLNNTPAEKPFTIYMSPQGNSLNQNLIQDLSAKTHMILICGRYEGLDQRFIEQYVDLEISVGDFVVSGGEIPAMLLIDGIIRQQDGVINKESVTNDSFMNGLLDFPHYSKPNNYNGAAVPTVLSSGNHEEIRKWRLYQSLLQTYKKRPDILRSRKDFSKEELNMILDIVKQENS